MIIDSVDDAIMMLLSTMEMLMSVLTLMEDVNIFVKTVLAVISVCVIVDTCWDRMVITVKVRIEHICVAILEL